MADIREIKDLSVAITRLAAELNDVGDNLVNSFSRSASKASDFSRLLEEILVTSTDLPKSMKTTSALMAKMNTDARFFEKIQSRVFDLQQRSIRDYHNKAIKKMHQHLDLTKDEVEQARIFSQVTTGLIEKEEEITKQLTLQLGLMRKQHEQKGLYRSTSDFVKSFAPNSQAAKFSHSMDGIIEKFQMLKKYASSGKGLLAAGLGLGAITGIGSAVAAFEALKTIFMATYDFVDNKVMPANAKLNKEFGNMTSHMGDLRKQAISTGVQFEYLGYDFQQGAEAVSKLASSMNSLSLGKEVLNTGLMLSEYVGLGAEKAGKLLLAFEKTGVSIKDVNGAMKDASKIAYDYGVPVNQIRRDLGENVDLLARFGTANVREMLKSAAKVRLYGMTIKDVNASFGKSMDTFEGTSEAAAKLNTIFGSNINSLELMLETNPEKRMEMVRSAITKQGLSWEKLNAFEKNVITSTLNLSEEQAQLAFASEDTRRKIVKQMEAKKRAARVDEDWNKGLTNIKQTLVAIGPHVQQLLIKLGNVVSQLFGFKSGSESATTAAKGLEEIFKQLGDKFDQWNAYLKKNPKTIADFKSGFEKAIGVIKWGIESVDKLKSSFEFLGQAIRYTWEATKMLTGLKAIEVLAQALGTMMGSNISEERMAEINNQAAAAKRRSDLAEVERSSEKMPLVPLTANDALITKKGEFIKFNPQDNIIATKMPITREMMSDISSGKTGKSWGGSNVQIEIIDVNIDGRKVGEAQVRISRS